MKPSEQQIQITFNRLFPRLESYYSQYLLGDPAGWEKFSQRVIKHFPRLFSLYYQLYANQYDFYFHLEDLLSSLVRMWFERPDDLKSLDGMRELEPLWFQSNRMLGGVIYVNLFAGDLEGVRQRIPYFKQLGLTYLHLMPLFRVPDGENDGGYAVSSYREVNSSLGTMEQLAGLARELRLHGISLVLDLVFNHTSDEHTWAKGARQGDPELRQYYRIFPDRKMPDAYEATLREIFPDEHPGAYTYFEDMDSWIWTTFHSFQWDLNYDNPAVFNRMAEEMLFLANNGVEILRLDAVAFIWKKLGTNCENLPEAHRLIQAFNAVARIAAPALLFKSEAIVHPDEVVRYISPEECQLSYNPLLMALLWDALATRKIQMLSQALRERFVISPGCSWVNYVRCHDDIGWTFSDDDAWRLGINGYDHRRFLNAFYTGRFEGSFARGLPFQENPKTGDARISGTCASLIGLEKGLQEGSDLEIEYAIQRILLIHAIILTIGGVPLLYLGDEIGTLNDYSYRLDPTKTTDSRWVHRPSTNWAKVDLRHDPETIEGKIYQGIRRLIELRQTNPIFAGQNMQVIDTGNPHVLGFLRSQESQRVIVLANFCEAELAIDSNLLRIYGLSYDFLDLLDDKKMTDSLYNLRPYQVKIFRSL